MVRSCNGITACNGRRKCRNASIGAGCYGITAFRACVYVRACTSHAFPKWALRSFLNFCRNAVTTRASSSVTDICSSVTSRNAVIDEMREVVEC